MSEIDNELLKAQEEIMKEINNYKLFVEKEALKIQKENKVLKRALELACQTIKEIMPDKPLYICGQGIADRLGIPMFSELKDYEWFVGQAQKELEKEQKDEENKN